MSHTPQLREKIRVDIGKMLIAHEMVKLFPLLFDYEELKIQVEAKWKKLEDEITVRDFWNLIDSIMMGYKLKNITRDITSMQYSWSLVEAQEINGLKFSTDINGLNSNTKTALDIRSFLRANPTDLKRITDGTSKEFPENNTRHLDPIIVLKQGDDFFVHDGNGRLLKAIVEEKTIINAYVGTTNPAVKSDHWVPTSYLMKLADAKYKEQLLIAFSESDNAVFEFQSRVIVKEKFKREVLERFVY